MTGGTFTMNTPSTTSGNVIERNNVRQTATRYTLVKNPEYRPSVAGCLRMGVSHILVCCSCRHSILSVSPLPFNTPMESVLHTPDTHLLQCATIEWATLRSDLIRDVYTSINSWAGHRERSRLAKRGQLSSISHADWSRTCCEATRGRLNRHATVLIRYSPDEWLRPSSSSTKASMIY